MSLDPASAFNRDGSLDEDAVSALASALVSKQDGRFTYLEFRQAVHKLEARGIAQTDAYESVYTTAETIGVSRDALMESAAEYLATLDRERSNFKSALDKRLTDGLAEDERQIAAAEKHLVELAEQQRELQLKIEKTKAARDGLKLELETVVERVNARGAAFESAYAGMSRDIESDLANMRRYATPKTRL